MLQRNAVRGLRGSEQQRCRVQRRGRRRRRHNDAGQLAARGEALQYVPIREILLLSSTSQRSNPELRHAGGLSRFRFRQVPFSWELRPTISAQQRRGGLLNLVARSQRPFAWQRAEWLTRLRSTD